AGAADAISAACCRRLNVALCRVLELLDPLRTALAKIGRASTGHRRPSRELEPHAMGGDNGSDARLDAILTRAALTRPQRAAVIFQDTSWTYGEVHDRARRLAGALAALGVEKGDRVALWAANRAEFVEVLFGVPMLGAIASPLDHW